MSQFVSLYRISKHLTAAVLGLTLGLSSLVGCASSAPVATNPHYYRHADVSLQGYIAYPKSGLLGSQRQPAVLVIPEWWGLNDYAKSRADQLADLGYVALAADMYGGGKTSNRVEDAKQWSGALYGTPLMAQRARAALDVLRNDPRVDPNRIIAIGYCFGGTAAVELAYSGAPIKGAVSFHGTPASPTDEQAAALKARLLILTGAMDPMFDADAVKKLVEGLNKTNADFEVVTYGQAVHSFTNTGADAHNIPGVAYNKKADQRSWDQLQLFMKQLFAGQ